MGSFAKPIVCLVTPGTRDANNGNWRTAARWSAMLRDRCRVIVQTAWDGETADALIALHARRSAASIASFRTASPGRPIALVLTGTDLYHDLPQGDADTKRSIELADRLVVLQEHALRALAPHWRRKCEVIFQSAHSLAAKPRAKGRLDCVVVGHLRDVKDPSTVFRAMAQLPRDRAIRIRHIGAPLDRRLGAAARALERRDPRYRYLGALPHGLTRIAITQAHVLIHPSVAEGGANVIVEAVTAGTPVIASRIPGNLGMLGGSYSGYFAAGDESALAGRLVQVLDDPEYLARIRRECALRKPLFDPRAEARAVRGLVAKLLA